LRRRFAPISPEHPLGTDENGRDVLSRLMYGGRVSLGVGFPSVLAAITIGTALGGLAGYFAGRPTP
jgi:peptide/nickel transport system permease protein